MGRLRRTARKSTGGRPPRLSLFPSRLPKYELPESSEDLSSVEACLSDQSSMKSVSSGKRSRSDSSEEDDSDSDSNSSSDSSSDSGGKPVKKIRTLSYSVDKADVEQAKNTQTRPLAAGSVRTTAAASAEAKNVNVADNINRAGVEPAKTTQKAPLIPHVSPREPGTEAKKVNVDSSINRAGVEPAKKAQKAPLAVHVRPSELGAELTKVNADSSINRAGVEPANKIPTAGSVRPKEPVAGVDKAKPDNTGIKPVKKIQQAHSAADSFSPGTTEARKAISKRDSMIASVFGKSIANTSGVSPRSDENSIRRIPLSDSSGNSNIAAVSTSKGTAVNNHIAQLFEEALARNATTNRTAGDQVVKALRELLEAQNHNTKEVIAALNQIQAVVKEMLDGFNDSLCSITDNLSKMHETSIQHSTTLAALVERADHSNEAE